MQPTHAHIHTCRVISISLQFQACFLLKCLYYCLKDRFQSSAATRISGRRIWRLVRTCRFGQCNNHIWLSFDLRFPMFIIGDSLSKTISIWVRQPFLGEWFLVWSATCAPSGNAIWQYTTNIRKEATGCRCVAGQDNCSRYRKACEDIYAKYHQDMKGVSAFAFILLRSRRKGGGVMNIIWISLSNRCSRVASMISSRGSKMWQSVSPF